MKKKHSLGTALGVGILCCILLCGCAPREIANTGSRGTNIICFGDSITFGYGAQPGEDYPSILAVLTGAPVINAGIDGDTTEEALKRLRADVLERDPLLVIIEFCGNDFLRKFPQEVTVYNISRMIDLCQQAGAMVALADISAGIFLKEYRKAFKELAVQKKAIFIPSILEGIVTNPRLKSDFLHPNSEGYKTIARRIHQAITPYLERNLAIKNTRNDYAF